VLEVGGAGPMRLHAASVVINAAGLGAVPLAKQHAWLSGRSVAHGPRYARGNYFALQGRSPFKRT
jgi:L-2-hydroxyglutarate oxidase LhgO